MKKELFTTLLFLALALTASAQRTLRDVFVKKDPEVSNRVLWWQDNRDRTKATLVDGHCRIVMDDYTLTWHFDKGVPRAGVVTYYRHDGSVYGRQYDQHDPVQQRTPCHDSSLS